MIVSVLVSKCGRANVYGCVGGCKCVCVSVTVAARVGL